MKRVCVLSFLVVFSPAMAQVSVRTVDFLGARGLSVNAAGPVLVRMDAPRDRLVVAHTLTSSVSIVDCRTREITNIPVGGRALQHLKNESLAVNGRTGEIYLVGSRCFSVIHPDTRSAETFPTDVQFESVAVDEATGNAFLVGRESKDIAIYRPGAGKLATRAWLEHREPLVNLNATPPPPIRKVVADGTLGRVFAVDGFTSTLFALDARSGKVLASRPIPLASGGRWHLAGYDEKTRSLFVVVETAQRKVIQAGKIDVEGKDDLVVPLPEYTEGVGILYNPVRREVYVPYDNHPSVHVVSFENGGRVHEIAVPAYGNDASALDATNGILYIGSWAHGEVDVLDLEARRLVERIENLGIVPHMFAMAFDPGRNLVYFPKGASAVNGTFGAAVTVLDPATGAAEKIRTGWAPIALVEVPSRKSVFVFSSEDEFAEVRADGSFEMHKLPFDYPVCASPAPHGEVYLSYGPHQSYWPVVYIWGAKNGILGIDPETMRFYDRRIPRQAHKLVLDRDGVAYFTQNNWGEEEQFVGVLPDAVRLFDVDRRIRLRDKVTRETTQRILAYDADRHALYLVRTGENDTDPSVLQMIDLVADSVTHRATLGLTATSLCDAGDELYVSNFDSHTVSVIDKESFDVRTLPTGKQPLRLCRLGTDVWVLTHGDNTLERLTGERISRKIPFRGSADAVFPWKGALVVASHSERSLTIGLFDPEKKSFTTLHRMDYPYGDTRFDTANVSFYLRGQFGDAVFALCEAVEDGDSRLWLTDFLSGKLFVLESKG